MIDGGTLYNSSLRTRVQDQIPDREVWAILLFLALLGLNIAQCVCGAQGYAGVATWPSGSVTYGTGLPSNFRRDEKFPADDSGVSLGKLEKRDASVLVFEGLPRATMIAVRVAVSLFLVSYLSSSKL
jgi:hypothetical protein